MLGIVNEELQSLGQSSWVGDESQRESLLVELELLEILGQQALRFLDIEQQAHFERKMNEHRDGQYLVLSMLVIWLLLGGLVSAALLRRIRGFSFELEETNLEKRRLADTLTKARDMVGIADRDGKVLFLNETGREMLGVGDRSNLNLAMFHRKEALEFIEEVALPTCRREGAWEGTLEFCASDGRIIHTSTVLVAHYDEAGEFQYVAGMARDIGSAIKKESELKESEARFRTFFEKNQSVMLLHRPGGGRITAVNDKARTYYGCTEEEMLALSVTELEEGEGGSTESRHRRPGKGDVRDVEIHSTQIRVQGESLLFSIIHDITERNLTRQNLIEAKTSAERANRTRAEFLAVMSHEIRTPLNVILGMGELLGETELTPGQEQNLTTLQRAGHNLLALISDILDLSVIESGKLEMDVEKVEIRLLVEEIRSSTCNATSPRERAWN